jgi:hypothetical protein
MFTAAGAIAGTIMDGTGRAGIGAATHGARGTVGVARAAGTPGFGAAGVPHRR